MAEKNAPPVTIKTEPGTYKRLPSFRSPRDLKLTEFRQTPGNSLADGKPKKVYIPNLNIQRRKPTSDDSSAVNNAVGERSEKGHRGNDRGRGRGRKPANLIQSSGVFSEGLSCNTKSSRFGGRGGRNSGGGGEGGKASSTLPRPKLELSNKIVIDKEEEELVMKELMRDDFLDDPDLKPDLDQCPVQLPLCGFESNIFKKEVDEEKPVVYFKDHKKLLNGIKVKSEFSNVEESTEEKPRDLQQMKPLTAQELLLKSSENTYIFFQLPTSMPGPKVKIKQEVQEPGPASLSKNQSSVEDSQGQEKTVLRTLPPGRIGTLQILKSGRARLVLGDAKLWVEPGTQASFKQDLMSIPLNTQTLTGNMINLGPVTTRMIITPDWEAMLCK